MPRPIVHAAMLFLAGPAFAQTAADPAEQAVIEANRAIREHNDKIAAENAAAQAAYRQEVARVEAQRRANEAGYAAATAAFEAKQAQYEAAMAAWRVESAQVAAQARASAKLTPANAATTPKVEGGGLVCRRITLTGSLLPGKRVCRTRAEWARGD